MKYASLLMTLKNSPSFRLNSEGIFFELFHSQRGKLWEDWVQENDEIASFIRLNAGEIKRNEDLLLHWKEKAGVHAITPFDSTYPRSFYYMQNPPWVLYMKGRPVWMASSFLSVVGSREITSESLAWMEEHLSPFLRKTKAGIVSGGARGVDLKAHQMCLREGAPTIAFLPSGFARIYPSDFESYAAMIIESGGALVSEYEPFVEMRKQFFRARNRLIANIGIATLIVQAQIRSGTMLTAQHSIESSRPLFVIPAHPREPRFTGNLKLMSEGATIITCAYELMSAFEAEQKFDHGASLHLVDGGANLSLFS